MKSISDIAIIALGVMYAIATSNMMVTEVAKILPYTN